MKEAGLVPAVLMASRKDTKQFLKKAQEMGFEITFTNSKHYRLSKHGQSVILSGTPSDYRGVKNALAELRRIDREGAGALDMGAAEGNQTAVPPPCVAAKPASYSVPAHVREGKRFRSVPHHTTPVAPRS